MNKSESIKELSIALSKFQADITNPQNSKTVSAGKFSYKYAPLDEILNLVRPILSKNGLSIVQMPVMSDGMVGVTTTLLHSSGEWIETEPMLLKLDKQSAQGAGSAITYARRYAISSILGISSQDDDDANSIEPKSNSYKTNVGTKEDKNVTAMRDGSLASDKQLNFLYKLVKDKSYGAEAISKYIETAYKKKSSKELTKQEASEIIEMLNGMEAKE